MDRAHAVEGHAFFGPFQAIFAMGPSTDPGSLRSRARALVDDQFQGRAQCRAQACFQVWPSLVHAPSVGFAPPAIPA